MPGGFQEEGVPTRFIAAWSGDIANIPPGWVLCDGNNGTPDLLDRFVVGTISGSVGTGGTGGQRFFRLSMDQVPQHSHTGETTEDGEHGHDGEFDTVSGVQVFDDDYAGDAFDDDTESSEDITSEEGAHQHSVDRLYQTGGGGAILNRPKYYELAFIAPL